MEVEDLNQEDTEDQQAAEVNAKEEQEKDSDLDNKQEGVEARGEKQEDLDNNDLQDNEKEGINEATASQDKPSADSAQASFIQGKGSTDQVDQSEITNEGQEGSKSEEQGVGESDANMMDTGYEGTCLSSTTKVGGDMKPEEGFHPRTLDEHKEERSLGENEAIKKLHTVESTDSGPNDGEEPQKSSVYEHMKKTQSRHDAETIDLATEEQAETRPVASHTEEEEIKMDEDILPDPTSEPTTKEIAKTLQSELKKADRSTFEEAEDKSDSATKEEVGERVPTLGAERGSESTIHTQYDLWSSMSMQPSSIHFEPQVPMDVACLGRTISSEAETTWRQIDRSVAPLVQELYEQLRLVLEPTKTAKMKGDYRTGKRLNMRKVITYIASQFRKDKIWLRRTKPSKRQYQIVIALDDSSSMDDNQSRQMAYESLAVLGKTLTVLEAGDLAVVSFGERVNLVHPLGEAFTDSAGARILQELTFVQQKTCVAKMLQFATELLYRSGRTASRDTAQLLVIVSDGRGIFNEGEEKVKQAVRRTKECNIFTAFVILDNPKNKDSILDMKVPHFTQHGLSVEFHSYMERFPFPFYLILRDISAMPVVLGEALRQWFELVVSSDR